MKGKTSENISARKKINEDMRAWKFIRDVNNVSLNDLNRTALIDGSKKYTYGLMMREWERYASVFSAVGMTGEDSARVGILGSTCSETIISFYGLNMTGADVSVIPSYSSLNPNRVIRTIRDEKLTDFIITDDIAQMNLINELMMKKSELGLNNVIILHVPVTGVTVFPALSFIQECKYRFIKTWYSFACMDELLLKYGDHMVNYASEESSDTSLILHTSGTTSGSGNPIPLSDRALNKAASGFYETDWIDIPPEEITTAAVIDLSNAYSMIDQVHVPLAMGASIVLAPAGILNPWFYKAIPEYGINFMFTISAMFEHWIKIPDQKTIDLSGLRYVIMGGAAVSASDKKRYHEFMKEHGAEDVTLLNGYGISEMGGACCLSTDDPDDEAIGYPLDGVSVRLYDEDEACFPPVTELPAEGVLYLNSEAMATPVMDGREMFRTETIDGKLYVCTNDLMRMDEDGKLTFLGRANRYFINDEGRKYESGRVETEFSRKDGIESCGVVPVYIKTTHDNIPMLCVSVRDGEGDPVDVVTGAMKEIFITGRTLEPGNIPSRVLISDELPRNQNGKIDLYRINRGEVDGDIYTVKTATRAGQIKDIRLIPYDDGPADMIKEVFDGISAELKDSLPFGKRTDTDTEKESGAMDTKKMFENFSSMNKMGMQMMQSMMKQMNPGVDMPDMQQFMKNMQEMHNQAVGKMPGMDAVKDSMKQMNQKASDTMPEMVEMLRKMNAQMMIHMQQQSGQMMAYMEQMNKITLELMQKMSEQHVEMMNQMLETAKSMSHAAGQKAEPEDEVPAKKSAPSKKSASSKAAKTEKKAKTEKADKEEKTEA